MFDLGGTLIGNDLKPFPNARKAVRAISALKTAAGKRLGVCLVSDFDMTLTVTAAMKGYLKVLDGAGLRSLFEPVEQRVTLSNHAGKLKPNRAIFVKALQRLGLAGAVPLEDCLLITEQSDHIQKVRDKLHMHALHFGVDFRDWAEAPSRISALLAPPPVRLISEPISVPGEKDLKKIHVSVPSKKHAKEARNFASSLAANDQIGGRKGAAGKNKPLTRPTHEIETDSSGKRKLVRKRFTAF
jgi:hypothetical protein